VTAHPDGEGAEPLGVRIAGGFAWSALGSALLRLGTLLTGVVLARVLVPAEFGVFAVALMVQAIVINLAELGLAADLVRHGDLDRRGPTITVVALVASSLLALLMWTGASTVASFMGAPDATWPIRLMALTIPMAGLTAVPYAQLQREFRQSRLFAIDGVNFVVGTTNTLALAFAGAGALSLAVGRVAGQSVSTVMQFAATKRRVRLGWRPDVARSGIRFGLPLACAGVLAWTLLNVDTMLVGRVAGVTALGFYVLAFNVSSWPTSVIGTAVRAVAFPAFAQRSLVSGQRDTAGVVRATALVWAASLPLATALAVCAQPVVEVLYGTRWLAAAPVLQALAVFGALRVVFDLWVAYFTACGASGTLLLTQAGWIVVLVPAMWWGLSEDGIRGAGWSHAAVALAVMLPVYLWCMRRCEVSTAALLRVMAPPLLPIVPAAFLGAWVVEHGHGVLEQLVLGSAAVVTCYGLLLLPWLQRVRRELQDHLVEVAAREEVPR
jgi:PST family polysaccharide transporter